MEEKKKRGRPKKIVEQKLGETEMALKEENLIKKNEAEKIEKIDETEKINKNLKIRKNFYKIRIFKKNIRKKR